MLSCSCPQVSTFNVATWDSFVLSIQNREKLEKMRREQSSKKLSLPPTKPPKQWVYCMPASTLIYSLSTSHWSLSSSRSLFYSEAVEKWCLPFPGPDRGVVRPLSHSLALHCTCTCMSVTRVLDCLEVALTTPRRKH